VVYELVDAREDEVGTGFDGEDVICTREEDQIAIQAGMPVEKSDSGGWSNGFVFLSEKNESGLMHPGELLSSSVDEAMELSQCRGGHVGIAEEAMMRQIFPILGGFGYRANDGGEKGGEKEETGVQIEGRTEETESAKPLGFLSGEKGAEDAPRR